FLGDPQQLNTYSYARGNPIVYRDPSGKAGELAQFGYELQQQSPEFGPLGLGLFGLGSVLIAAPIVTHLISKGYTYVHDVYGELTMQTGADSGSDYTTQPGPNDPNNLKDPKKNLNNIGKIIFGTIAGSVIGHEIGSVLEGVLNDAYELIKPKA